MQSHVSIIGGAPAGASAALSALLQGSAVQIFEKSPFPRHKVCGEFISPAMLPILERLGVNDRFMLQRPAIIHRAELTFENKVKRFLLPEPAFGLSRYRFDQLLLQAALDRGAVLVSETADWRTFGGSEPLVIAHGRPAADGAAPEKGTRQFGFKAHFAGPPRDAVELFFFDGCYFGINAIEDSLTNVCGIGAERLLRECQFNYDEFVSRFSPLAQRLLPLVRQTKWHSVGPLEYSNRFDEPAQAGVYEAGDALSFVDPFTGSGLLGAVATGLLAGQAAASGVDATQFRVQAQRVLGRPFGVSSLLRSLTHQPWAMRVAALAPGSLMFHLTRPRVGHLPRI